MTKKIGFVTEGDSEISSLPELFQQFTARTGSQFLRPISANVTHGTRLTESRRLLRSAEEPSQTLGRLYPDILIGNVDVPAAVIDAKYKPLTDRRGVDREDLYQLVAYLAAYDRPQTVGALVYPGFPEQDEFAYAERFSPWRSPRGNQLRFQQFPTTEAGCVDALRALIDARGI